MGREIHSIILNVQRVNSVMQTKIHVAKPLGHHVQLRQKHAAGSSMVVVCCLMVEGAAQGSFLRAVLSLSA
jgi:hypothetical protein